jgi:2-polyprenyl-3-methyl-5-hydroxy-6-metoxy-1,4-benzoquinol methylase
MVTTVQDYLYHNASNSGAHSYLWPVVEKQVAVLKSKGGTRVFDLGCGNGAIAGQLSTLGLHITGIDSSASGIEIAQKAYPNCQLRVGSVYDDLASQYGQFPLVVSLEVIEHLYDPRSFARTLYALLEPQGVAIVSTPYHGYIKNCALALSGKMDQHFTVLWDGGHVKFFSIRTLGIVLREAGFDDIQFQRVGRIPVLAKSMIAIVKKRAAP